MQSNKAVATLADHRLVVHTVGILNLIKKPNPHAHTSYTDNETFSSSRMIGHLFRALVQMEFRWSNEAVGMCSALTTE